MPPASPRLQRMRSAGRAVGAATSPRGGWRSTGADVARPEHSFPAGTAIDVLDADGDGRWHAAVVEHLTPRDARPQGVVAAESAEAWHIEVLYDEGGKKGTVQLEDHLHRVRFAYFRPGAPIFVEHDGEWYAATVTGYVRQGLKDPWRVEFESVDLPEGGWPPADFAPAEQAFPVGTPVDVLYDEEGWLPGLVTEYTPPGQREPWRVQVKFDKDGTSDSVDLADDLNRVRFAHFREGALVWHHSDGEGWQPATVTDYTPQGQQGSAWRLKVKNADGHTLPAGSSDDAGIVEITLDDDFSRVMPRSAGEAVPRRGVVLLDGGFNRVVPRRGGEPPPGGEPEPEPDPEPQRPAELGLADLNARMAGLDGADDDGNAAAEVAELRKKLAAARSAAARDRAAKNDAVKRAEVSRRREKEALAHANRLSSKRWAPRRLRRGRPERLLPDDLRMSRFDEQDACAVRRANSEQHWQMSKEVWARLTWPNSRWALRGLAVPAIIERLRADAPDVSAAGGRPWLLFPSYERRAELFWRYHEKAEDGEQRGDVPAESRPIATRVVLTAARAKQAVSELWPSLNSNRVALGRAFRAACGVRDTVEWRDFAPLLRATIFFQEMWARLEEVADRDDATLGLVEFQSACEMMGQRLSEADSRRQYAQLRAESSGRVLFGGFCEWLARCHVYHDADKLEPVPWATPHEVELEEEERKKDEEKEARKEKERQKVIRTCVSGLAKCVLLRRSSSC